MEENSVIEIIDEDGTERSATILNIIELKEFGKEYVLYTFGEIDNDDLETIYASTILNDNGKISFGEIKSDKEWDKIKDIMKETIKQA